MFNRWFSFSSDQQNYETASSTQGNLVKHFYKTNRYEKYSIAVSAVESWNKIHKQEICYLKISPPIKLKLVSAIFYQIFIFSPNGSILKTMKNVFYFI